MYQIELKIPLLRAADAAAYAANLVTLWAIPANHSYFNLDTKTLTIYGAFREALADYVADYYAKSFQDALPHVVPVDVDLLLQKYCLLRSEFDRLGQLIEETQRSSGES